MSVSVPQLEDRDGGSLGAAVAALWELTLLLREHCPWDQAQTAGTIVPHTMEEAWEVADEVRRIERHIAAGDTPELAALGDELGDLLFQVVFLAMWCHEREPALDLEAVARGIFTKLVRRHPHVFGDEPGLDDEAAVLEQWNRIKRERESRGPFDGVPASMPAVARAGKLQSRAAQMGFDFSSPIEALTKEEVRELREALERDTSTSGLPDPAVEHELGDVIFAAVNVGRLARVDAELAAGASAATFRARVERAMQLAQAAGEQFAEQPQTRQESWYQQAKQQLAAQ